MAYEVRFSTAAKKQFDALPRDARVAVAERLTVLGADPRGGRATQLKGFSDPAHYRLRVRDYRVVFFFDDARGHVNITKVEHRRDVYRDR